MKYCTCTGSFNCNGVCTRCGWPVGPTVDASQVFDQEKDHCANCGAVLDTRTGTSSRSCSNCS